jgi:hypothetical protein
LKTTAKKNNSSATLAGVLLATGVLLLVFAMLFEMQVAAFIGLGLTFWGALFALTRSGKYVESRLLDATARSSYSTLERMINDLKYSGRAYYLPSYPKDVTLPDYLKNLREPVVFISESTDGKPSVEELAQGKFLSAKTQGVFIAAPGAGLLTQLERQLHIDFSQIHLQELSEVLPKCLTDIVNLAKSAEMNLTETGVTFKATGILFESLYRADPPLKSVQLLGCPLVSAMACAVAKNTGRTVYINEQVLSPGNCGVYTVFNFSSEKA